MLNAAQVHLLHFTTPLQNIMVFTSPPTSWAISQHLTYFKTYISAAHLAAMVGEFYCVCELSYVEAAAALVSVVSDLCQQNQ
jgi:hypothetical protein